MNGRGGGAQARRLTPDDAAAYVALRAEMLADAPWAFESAPGDDPHGSDPERVAASLALVENAIVGVDHPSEAGALAAAAGIVRSNRVKTRHRALVWGVYASPAVRGRGFGRLVMTAAIEIARAWEGVGVVCLSASAASTAAIRLYESLGFVRWGVQEDVVRLGDRSYDEVYLQLRL